MNSGNLLNMKILLDSRVDYKSVCNAGQEQKRVKVIVFQPVLVLLFDFANTNVVLGQKVFILLSTL